jgi:hypothetical protein
LRVTGGGDEMALAEDATDLKLEALIGYNGE